MLHVLIFTALFAALALSYDLVVGHVGSLSLAHPAFFGVGAYTAALLATRAGWPFLGALIGAALAAGVVAALVGVPLFRLTEHAFAVGTLGLALVASVVANNWVEVTRGPLCITEIPKPVLGVPGGPGATVGSHRSRVSLGAARPIGGRAGRKHSVWASAAFGLRAGGIRRGADRSDAHRRPRRSRPPPGGRRIESWLRSCSQALRGRFIHNRG